MYQTNEEFNSDQINLSFNKKKQTNIRILKAKKGKFSNLPWNAIWRSSLYLPGGEKFHRNRFSSLLLGDPGHIR